ncbi:MAG TPA: sulfite reductase subunit alpha [Opitutaceae bacterium]
MSTVPVIPDHAPFTPEQRAWLNGFLAGLLSRGPAPAGGGAAASAAPALQPLTILFGSQTGTAEGLARKVAKEAGKRGFAPTVVDMAQTDAAKLASEKNMLVITSTYGDGEPPDNAKALHTALAADSAPSLAGVRFSVCALGDTNYTQFCRCGQDFDAFLEKRGATRASPRVDCDLDYEEKFNGWLTAALGAFGSGGQGRATTDKAADAQSAVRTPQSAIESGYSRKNPFPATLLTTRTLNGAGSAKQVNHVEFDLAGSGLVYEAGDALGVFPHNCTELVGELLAALGCDGEEAVPAPDGSTTSLRHALTALYDLGKPSAELLAIYAPGAGGGVATATAHHVIDAVLARRDVKIAPAEFVRTLKKLQPRLYSISSSPKAHPGQVHLTVGAVRYEANGRRRIGVCSTFLADRCVVSQTRVPVFVHTNNAFRPPASGDMPMIMVGPGTGIAPFRAFLEERRATGAKGKNWLFFGDQRAATDYLYRDELETMQREGFLTRLDTAFSRDQAEKIYVQQRMLENATELYAWLEAGAHFYVCGDASRMAKDVDAALHQVVERAGGRSPEQAAAYIQSLKAAKRYQRDVY